jgi:hypothetical protein
MALGCDWLDPRCHWRSGWVCGADIAARQLDYLTFATQSLDPGSIANAIAHMERDRIDPTYAAPAGASTPVD